MTVSAFVSDIIDKIIIEIKNEKNLNKLENNLIDPLIQYTFKRIYPYVALASIIFLLIFILSLLILFLQVKAVYIS